MPKPPENSSLYPDATEIYRSYVEETIPFSGWPKGWPDIEAPSTSEWWRKTKTIPPDLPKRTRLRPLNARLFEISGLPQAGKSSSKAEAVKKIRGTTKGWKIHDWPELVRSAGPNAGLLLGTSDPLDEDDIGLLPFEKFDGQDWFWALHIQALKENSLLSRIRGFEADAFSRARSQFASLAYRGPVDGVIWYYTLASHQAAGSPFVIPAAWREVFNQHLPFLAGFATMIRRLEAVVLIGIDQQEAQERRATAGKTAPGWIADSPIYRDLSA